MAAKRLGYRYLSLLSTGMFFASHNAEHFLGNML